MVFWSFVVGLGLGLSLAAPPGAMNALIARESSRHDAWHGIRVGLGAPVADVVWLLVLWFGLGRFLDGPLLVRVLAAAGALLMAYFSFTTFRDGQERPQEMQRKATFTAGFAMAITNPYQAAWWFSGGFVFLQDQGGWGVLGLIVGIFAWVVCFAWLVAHGAQRWKWFTPTIRVASGTLLALFAVLLGLVAAGVIQV